MADDIAKMRAALTDGASVSVTGAPSNFDNAQAIAQSRSLPDLSTAFKPIEALYQNMPGASLVQGVLPTLEFPFQVAGSALYGLGKQIFNPSDANFDRDTTKAMQALQYTPPTQAGKNVANTIAQAPEAITGSSMPISPLPEIWNNPPRFTPEDLRAGATSAITDVRNFPMDYANAKMGLQREYPTLGSRAAGVTDTATAMAKPLAEIAYNQVMENGNIKMPGGLPDIPVYNYAVKPKGGNWPTNLGSTIPLSEQSSLGKHLSILQIDDPVKAFVKQFEKHHPSILDNYRLQQAWEEFLNEYGLKKDPEFNNYVGKNPRVLELTKEAANEFAEKFNIGAEQAGNKKLYTPAQIEEIAPHYNAWIMGPYQKYITNQMGTGLETDPMLKTLDEANVPISNFFNQNGREIKGLFPEVKPLTETQASIIEHGRESALRKYRDTNQNLLNTNIGKETALTPSGKRMEADIDRSLYPRTFAYSKFDDPKYPAGSKLERYSVVNDLNHYDVEEGTGLPAVRKRVLHDLLQGKLQPKDLQKALPANILQKLIDEYKSAQKSKEAVEQAKDDWRKSRFESIQSDVPYDDGSKMHIIRPEDVQTDTGKNLALRDLGLSTIDLKQCIGAGCRNTPDYPTPEYNHGPYIEPHTGKVVKGADPYEQTHARRYMDRLERGKAEIARLLDPKGVAQASVDMHYEAPRVLRVSQQADIIANWLEKNNHDAYLEFVNNKNNFGSAEAVKNAYQLYPEVREYVEKLQGVPTKYIAEMKGYDNQEVKPEYVPHMVKFLNQHADQLTDVRDFKNLPGAHDMNNAYDTVGKLIDKHPHWDADTVENFFDDIETNKLLPRFFTDEDFALKATDKGVDLSAPPKKSNNSPTLAQEAYEKLSLELRRTYEEDYLREFENGDQDVIQSIINDVDYHPDQYGLGKFGEHTRQMAIERLVREGLHNPNDINGIRQHAYETLSETIRRQAPQAFEQLRDNPIIRIAFADVVRADPTRYGISNYAPALQEIIINRFAREGFAPEQ